MRDKTLDQGHWAGHGLQCPHFINHVWTMHCVFSSSCKGPYVTLAGPSPWWPNGGPVDWSPVLTLVQSGTSQRWRCRKKVFLALPSTSMGKKPWFFAIITQKHKTNANKKVHWEKLDGKENSQTASKPRPVAWSCPSVQPNWLLWTISVRSISKCPRVFPYKVLFWSSKL